MSFHVPQRSIPTFSSPSGLRIRELTLTLRLIRQVFASTTTSTLNTEPIRRNYDWGSGDPVSGYVLRLLFKFSLFLSTCAFGTRFSLSNFSYSESSLPLSPPTPKFAFLASFNRFWAAYLCVSAERRVTSNFSTSTLCGVGAIGVVFALHPVALWSDSRSMVVMTVIDVGDGVHKSGFDCDYHNQQQHHLGDGVDCGNHWIDECGNGDGDGRVWIGRTNNVVVISIINTRFSLSLDDRRWRIVVLRSTSFRFLVKRGSDIRRNNRCRWIRVCGICSAFGLEHRLFDDDPSLHILVPSRLVFHFHIHIHFHIHLDVHFNFNFKLGIDIGIDVKLLRSYSDSGIVPESPPTHTHETTIETAYTAFLAVEPPLTRPLVSRVAVRRIVLGSGLTVSRRAFSFIRE
ncbi:hypothetical protein NMY22_g14912 [Coprinellus aureogranulatus]|nr:hypothetical protein NMY22_g14912 [Coprinellus aureogranulatus]